MQSLDQLDTGWWAGHILSLLALLGSVVGYFPAIAAFAAFIWYAIQIYESDTFKRATKRWHTTRTEARLAALQRQRERIEAAIKSIRPD